MKSVVRNAATAPNNGNNSDDGTTGVTVLKRLGCAIALLLSVSIVSAQPSNPHAGEPIGTVQQIYDGLLFPGVQVNTFRNIDRLFATRTVKRGDRVYPLPVGKPLANFKFVSGGKDYDLYDYVSLNRVSGLLVIKDGRIAHEQYELGNTENTRWMSMSIIKSFTASLVGAAIKDGYIKSLDERVTTFLPQFVGTAYEGVTVRNLVQMASGVRWNETYTDLSSDRRQMLEVQNRQKPGGVLELMARLPRAAEPGTRWNYSTGETHVVGALVRAAVKKPVAQYLSERIWAKFGMESDATWWLESPDGLEVGGSGLSATLRDYGRLGLFLLQSEDCRRPLGRLWLYALAHPQFRQHYQRGRVRSPWHLWPARLREPEGECGDRGVERPTQAHR